MKSFSEILQKLQDITEKEILAVAGAADEEVLKAVKKASDEGIAEAILVGDEEKIKEIAPSIGMELSKFEIVNEPDPRQACKKAVELVREGKANMLMKGLVQTADYLRAILDKEKGLRTNSLMSHIAFFELEHYPKLLGVTDAAMNIAPTLEEKVKIVQNAINAARAIGIEEPKVALLAAVETVNPKMPATLDAAAIAKMAARNQIKGGIVDGPLALDNAVSEEAAKHKKIESPVAGKADILVTPDIEAGNVLYKALGFLAKGKVGAVLVGAKVPVVLTSRADSDEAKHLSIALAAVMSKGMQNL